MAPADELRQAARHIRETVAALPNDRWSGEPWRIEDCDGPQQCACIVYQGRYADDGEAQLPPIQYVADGETEEHAEHIRLWQPSIALLVADLLDKEAGLGNTGPALLLARSINAKAAVTAETPEATDERS